jgi:transcriptional regulator GlxA family with amidase domain
MLREIDSEPSSSQRQVRDLVEFIEHDGSIVSVAHLTSVSGLPIRTLERAFHRYVGKSPKWVIRRYRLIEAAEQLLGGSPPDSLTKLALELGYYDHAHFTRDFHACIGRTPSELRRSVESG